VQLDRADIDGFYGEPAEFDPTLEVELVLHAAADSADSDVFDGDDDVTAPIPRLIAVAPAVEMIALDAPSLEDAWFGSFDETAEYPVAEFDDMPTTTWQRIGDWLRNLGRAA
jgi:hypothetical protein